MGMRNKKNPSSSRGKSERGNLIQGSKKFTIIQYLLKGGSLNRFEAELIGDHCLHTTISVISNEYGFEVPRKMEKVPNRFGGMTSVKRYWFSDNDMKIAELIKH